MCHPHSEPLGLCPEGSEGSETLGLLTLPCSVPLLGCATPSGLGFSCFFLFVFRVALRVALEVLITVQGAPVGNPRGGWWAVHLRGWVPPCPWHVGDATAPSTLKDSQQNVMSAGPVVLESEDAFPEGLT